MKPLLRNPLVWLVLAASIVLLVVLFPQKQKPAVDFTGIAFNSMAWQVRLSRLPEGVSRESVQQALQARIDEVDRILSTWRDDSELSAFNNSPAGSRFSASPLLQASVATALSVSDWSDGAYDITVGPLVNLWGFGPSGPRKSLPSDAEIMAAKRLVGWRHLQLPAGNTGILTKDSPVRIDLSSLGEGAAVDAMTAWLESVGARDYLVSVAGTLAVSGRKPDGSLWELAIERPDASGQLQKVLPLTDMAMSTSGAYRNYFERDGVRYSHTINPATGRPISHHGVSVTVLLPRMAGKASGVVARTDAMATALNVLGPDAGLQLAERDRVAALFIEKTPAGFIEKPTSAFKAVTSHPQ